MKPSKKYASPRKGFCTLTVTFIVVFFKPSLSSPSDVTKTSTCEYDIDLSNQKVKVVCQGSPSMVNVYANSAILQENDAQMDYDKRVMGVQESPFSFIPNDFGSETRQAGTGNRGISDTEPQHTSSERLTFPESNYWNVEDPFLFQRNREDPFGFMRNEQEHAGFLGNGEAPGGFQRAGLDGSQRNVRASSRFQRDEGVLDKVQRDEGVLDKVQRDEGVLDKVQRDEGVLDKVQRDEGVLDRIYRDKSVLNRNQRLEHEINFSDVVWNAGLKLQTAKQNLSSCTISIRNISSQLSQGDSNLRPDIDNLRMANNTAPDLTEVVISALRNQYNFMSNALLARSYEHQKLSSTMKELVDVTSDGLNSSLTAHRIVMDEVALLNDYLQTLRKKVSKGVSRREIMNSKEISKGREAQCPKEISAIGMATVKNMQWPTGSYMVESEHRSVFIMADTGTKSRLQEYNSALEFDYNLVGKVFTLPFSCSGTGHVIYRRHFYCHKAGSDMVVKYHLKKKEIVSELALPGAKFGNSNKPGTNTNIDLAVDELGMWAVYATDVSDGKLVIAKIDHKKMEIASTWPTYPKHQVGHTFMICGVLYATSSHNDTPTYIRYRFNTETKKEQWLHEGALPFALLRTNDSTQKTVEEKPTNSVMFNYDFRSSTLYSWTNGWLASYPIYFKDIGLK